MNSSWDEASRLPFSNSGSQDSCIQDCSATRCLYVLQGKAAKMNFRPNPKEKLKRKQHAWLTISVLYLWLDNVGKEWFSLADRLHSCEHSSRNMLLACLSLNYWAGTWEYPQGKKKKKIFYFSTSQEADVYFSFSRRSFSILASLVRRESMESLRQRVLLILCSGRVIKGQQVFPKSYPCVSSAIYTHIHCHFLIIFLCLGPVFSLSALWGV